MTPIILTERGNEDGTMVFQCSFLNESDGTVTPSTIEWSLTDIDSNIINSRQWVSVTPASTVYITLSGDDLIYVDGTSTKRRLIIYFVYTSDIVTAKPMYYEYEFNIDPISYTKREDLP